MDDKVGALAILVAAPDRAPLSVRDGGAGEALAALAHLARINRVDVSLAQAWTNSGLNVPEELETARRRATLVHLQTSRALRTIADRLDEREIPFAVVKGPAVARAWPLGTVTRTYEDLDILVQACDLLAAADALQSCGFAHRNRNWRGFIELGVAEVPLDDGSVVVDLHWNLVALAAQRSDLRLDTAALLRRTQLVDIAGISVPVLCDVDAFVHLCCHAALAGAPNLRMLRDVHLFAARVDPKEVRARLRDAGCDRLAAPVVDRAVRSFGPVTSPDGSTSDAERICGHPHWITINRLVDLAWSKASGWHDSTFPGAFVAAGRPGRGATVRTLVDRLVVAFRTRMGMSTVTSEGGPLHWDTDTPRDVAAGREAYMRYVRDEAKCG